MCRWLLPVAALPMALGVSILAPAHLWAKMTLAVMGRAAITVAIGARWPKARPMPHVVSLATFGTFASIAVLHAICRIIFGHNDHVWEPTRRTVTPTSA